MPSLRRPRSPPQALAAACVFLACRHEKQARTFKEITAVMGSDVSKKEIGRCFKVGGAGGLGAERALCEGGGRPRGRGIGVRWATTSVAQQWSMWVVGFIGV